jgi:hypothetical protein
VESVTEGVVVVEEQQIKSQEELDQLVAAAAQVEAPPVVETPAAEALPTAKSPAEAEAQAEGKTGLAQFNVPIADTANKEASQMFLRRLASYLKEARDGGVHKLKIEVSGVDEETVDKAEEELRELGYHVTFSHIIKTKAGYTSRQMIITY